jgi:S1-C subfamily serine protease
MDSALKTFSTSLAEAVQRASPMVAYVEARPRFGSSGVIWKPGVIVTADHTIRRDEEIQVTLPDGNRVKAEVAGRDPGTDLAVLRFEGGTAPQPLHPVHDLQPGSLILSVGRTEQGVTATMGIVSTAGGAWRTWKGGKLESFIRLDLALYPQSSGGALIDAEGRIAGIATSGLSRIAPIAIPAVSIDRVVSELLERGRIARGYLGVGLQPVPLPSTLRSKLDSQQKTAVIVLSVEPEGPAGLAGVIIGDVLLKLNGHELGDTDDVQSALDESRIGDESTLTLLRGGEVATLPVKIGERGKKG